MISIIIPVFNGECYIRQCLESVISQTVEKEIICINDGSTDSSLEILNEYARKHVGLIKVFSQENKGAGKARNYGISKATGKFIVFLDADDYYPNAHALEKLVEVAEQKKALVVGGNLLRVYENGKNELFGVVFNCKEDIDFFDLQDMYNYQRYIYDATLFNKKGDFPEYRRFQDPPFLINQLIKAKTISVIPDVVYCYRYNNPKIFNSREVCIDALNGVKECVTLASKYGLEKMYDRSLRNILRNLLPYICVYAYAGDKEVWSIIDEIHCLELEWHGHVGWDIDLRGLRSLIDKGVMFKNELTDAIISKKAIILYGAGDCGKKIYDMFFKQYPKLLGFAVSEENIEGEIDGYKIRNINDYAGKKKDALVVICVQNPESKNEIVKLLDRKGFNKIDSWDLDMLWIDQLILWQN